MTRHERTPSVYVVEDDEGVLNSLCALLAAHGHPTVPCRSAEAFLQVFDPALPACMVLDLRLPGMSGIELQAHLVSLGVTLPVVVVTAHGDIRIAVQAIRSGAIDLIEKPARAEDLLDAIGSCCEIVRNKAPAEIPKKIVADRLSRLTAREREVLGHLLNGKLNKEIGAALGISQRTVEVHRARIREKMQARGIADLIRMLG